MGFTLPRRYGGLNCPNLVYTMANEIISRYVADQLAQKVREGQHDETAVPSRRRLTMVFSDIVGFSDTADELEPEDLRCC
jgi:class 3 adenylate cyclase